MSCASARCLLVLLAVLLATADAQGQQPPPACPLLDASGCCGSTCRIGLCSALYSFGTALGAHNTTGIVWYERQGWQQLYGISNTADAACSQLQTSATAPAGATAPLQPFFCTWFGIQCRDTVFNSSCSIPAGSYGISKIEIVNNNLSGNLSSRAFLEPLQLLHDCGLRQLVIGGGYGELRGELGPEWGRLSLLRGLSIFTTNLTGTLPPEIGDLTALEYLDLGGNYITGTLPDTLGNLRSLRILNLGKNGFTDIGKALQGPLPPSLTQLQRLEVLSLESNELSGTLPPSLCRDMTALRAVSLKDNNFRGSITQMANCTLQSLDLSDNRFSGPLPIPLPAGPWGRPPWLRLMSISLANNMLTGELPEFPYGATPLLSIVSVAGNSINGSLPRSWTFLPWLSQVDVSYNRLSGTVPYELALQSMLTSLRLHSNLNITGTISPWFRLTVSLLTLTLHNTSVTGVLPGVSRSTFLSPGFDETRVCGGAGAGLGRLPALQLATISDTQMTAVCSESESKCDSIDDYLPWYLSTDPNAWEVPLPEPGFHDNSHMKCPRILAQEFCRLYRPPEPFADNMRPSWSVSPSYYHYKDCTCMGGYVASYITKTHGGVDIPVLVCSPAPTTLDPAEAAGVSVAASAVGMLLLAYCGYVSWYGRWGLPRLQRAVADLQKRREGAPTSGRVSICVTDIESYSALMVAMPLAMGQALSQHSNVIRRAAWTHYGFIVGQEGDSFIIGFRDACDAVAFCLQVQQGLTKVPWPVELLQHQQQQDLAAAASVVQQLLEQAAPAAAPAAAAAAPLLAVTTATAGGGSGGGEYGSRSPAASSLQVSPTSSPFQSFRGSRGTLCKTDSTTLEDLLSAPAAEAATDSQGQTAMQQDNLSSLLPRSSSSKIWPPRQQQQQGLNGGYGSSPLSSQDGKLLPSPAAASPSAAPAGTRLWRRPSSQDPGSPAVPTGTVSRDSGSFLRPLPSGVAAVAAAAAQIADSLRSMSPQQQVQQVQEQQLLAPCSVLIPGLRVRMGVASGVLGDVEDDCLKSAVLETARVVSDAGAGGQVLLCSTTFGHVKDRLEELGQVGSSGYVKSSRVTGWGAPKGWLARLARRHVQLAAEAVVLDMGLYSLPGVAVKPGTDHQRLLPALSAAASAVAVAAAGTASTGDTAAAVAPVRLGQPGQQQQQQQATVVKTGAQTSSSTTLGCVRLYQILAPKCVERALLFGNNLALKRGARCHDLPYFCAPAAASRSLLDMLLFEGPPAHAPYRSSFSNVSRGSRLWLRRKYRLPLAPSPVGAAGLLSAHSDRRAATASPRPWNSLSLHNGKTAGSSLLPIHQEGPRAQSVSLYSKQAVTPISLQTSLQDGTAASNCPSSPTAAADALATSAAATPTAEGAVVESAHGSVWSGATSSNAYPTVAIPLRGLAALWSSSGSDHAGTAANSGGITFVFASAVLPKWVRGDVGQLAARVSTMVGTVVRQTLLAFAAADGSGAAGPGEVHSSAAAGYLFRESTAEMKYLLSFHSPRAALEWCLLLQEALLWQDWPTILQNSRTAEASSHSRPAASAHQQQSTHQPAAAAAAGQEAVVNDQQAPPADLGAASSVLFSGPWVKMGVAAGAPQSVYPDYMGRADYHGNAVNMAARYEAVCAQPSQIVCDADLAASVMAEWAAAAAEAAAVESQLRVSAADAAASEATAAAAPAGPGAAAQPGLTAAAAGVATAQGTSTQQVSSSSRHMVLSTAAVSAFQQQQAQQDAAAAAVLRLPDTAQGAADTASFEAELLLQQEPSLTGAADVAAVPAAVLQGRQAPHPAMTAADGSTAFTSFHQGRNRGLAQVSLTSPFAAVAGSTRASSSTAAANAAAVSVGAQAAAQPARNRPIPSRGKAVRSSNHRGVIGSAPAAPTGLSNSYSSSSRGSPPVRAAAMAAAAAAAAAEGRQGQRSSLDSRTGAPPAAAASTKPRRRASSPGAAGDEAAATCSNISFSSGTGSGGGGGVPAVSTGNIPGLAGLGGGVGFYGAGCSRRLSSTLSNSASWSQQQQQHQQQQQQHKSWSGRSVLRPTSPFAALAPPQLLPLQPPPVALPCPAAVPEGLPPFQVSVQTYKLGRYRFKGASAPIAMVEVASSHLTPRRQHLQDPASLPQGPKGGIVEAEQGLVDDVTGVRLPGLAHLYRKQYQERLAAAAAAAAATAAAAGAAGGAGAERRAAFAMHRFLRNSLQQEQSTGKGSLSSASSAVVGPVGRLSSLLAQSFAAGGSNVSVVRRASGVSTGSSRASRGASDGGGGAAAAAGGAGAGGATAVAAE